MSLTVVSGNEDLGTSGTLDACFSLVSKLSALLTAPMLLQLLVARNF